MENEVKNLPIKAHDWVGTKGVLWCQLQRWLESLFSSTQIVLCLASHHVWIVVPISELFHAEFAVPRTYVKSSSSAVSFSYRLSRRSAKPE